MSERKAVVDLDSGIVYPSVKEAAIAIGVTHNAVCNYLRSSGSVLQTNGRRVKGHRLQYQHVLYQYEDLMRAQAKEDR